MTAYTIKPRRVDAIQWDDTEATAAAIEALIGRDRFTPPDPGSEEGGWDATPAGVLTDPHSSWAEIEPGTWIIRCTDGQVSVLLDDAFRDAYEVAPASVALKWDSGTSSCVGPLITTATTMPTSSGTTVTLGEAGR